MAETELTWGCGVSIDVTSPSKGRMRTSQHLRRISPQRQRGTGVIRRARCLLARKVGAVGPRRVQTPNQTPSVRLCKILIPLLTTELGAYKDYQEPQLGDIVLHKCL